MAFPASEFRQPSSGRESSRSAHRDSILHSFAKELRKGKKRGHRHEDFEHSYTEFESRAHFSGRSSSILTTASETRTAENVKFRKRRSIALFRRMQHSTRSGCTVASCAVPRPQRIGVCWTSTKAAASGHSRTQELRLSKKEKTVRSQVSYSSSFILEFFWQFYLYATNQCYESDEFRSQLVSNQNC